MTQDIEFNLMTLKLAFSSPAWARWLDDSYPHIPVTDDHRHTDPDYSVDDYLCWFEDREDIERDFCARARPTSREVKYASVRRRRTARKDI